MTVSIKVKEALIKKSAFPKLPSNPVEPPIIILGLAYTKILEEMVTQALMTQMATKSPGLNEIDFWILQIIWSWKKTQITSMVYHAIRLGYHFIE